MKPVMGAILFAAGLVLMVAPVAEILRLLSSADIGAGWGTLLGAGIGAAAIAYQARQGLKQIADSQRRQSQLDREARIEQHELEKMRAEALAKDDARTLAAALRGELVAYRHHLEDARKRVLLTSLAYKAIARNGAGDHPVGRVFVARFRPAIYDANVHRIGILGASLAGDVARVYAGISRPEGADPREMAGASVLAEIYEGMADGYSDAAKNANHVVLRLIAHETGEADPGPLA